MTSKPIFAIFLAVVFIVLSSFSPAFSWIPPTNAFDKIHSDNGTINAVNSSMPLNVNGGSGISVKSDNATHTLQISSTLSQASGTYNTTQANNVNINTGGYKINFINGTNNPIQVVNSPGKNQVNVTISSTGSGSGVTSLNALTGALNIVCVSGNTTCTTSGGNTITVNTAYNVVVTNGAVQTITKGITHTADLTMSNANIILGGNSIHTTNYKISESSSGIAFGSGIVSSPIPTNAGMLYAIAPTGTSTTTAFASFRTSDILTNYEMIFVGSDWVKANEFEIVSYHGGTGTLRPISVYMATTKLLSFDTANTVTNWVSTLFKTKITQYNSINTAGMGVPPIYAATKQKSETGADANVLTYTPPATAGMYVIKTSIDISAVNSSNIHLVVSYVDSNGKTITTQQIPVQQFSSSTITLAMASANHFYSTLPVDIDNSASNIVIGTTFAGTSISYKISTEIQQLQ